MGAHDDWPPGQRAHHGFVDSLHWSCCRTKGCQWPLKKKISMPIFHSSMGLKFEEVVHSAYTILDFETLRIHWGCSKWSLVCNPWESLFHWGWTSSVQVFPLNMSWFVTGTLPKKAAVSVKAPTVPTEPVLKLKFCWWEKESQSYRPVLELFGGSLKLKSFKNHQVIVGVCVWCVCACLLRCLWLWILSQQRHDHKNSAKATFLKNCQNGEHILHSQSGVRGPPARLSWLSGNPQWPWGGSAGPPGDKDYHNVLQYWMVVIPSRFLSVPWNGFGSSLMVFISHCSFFLSIL